MTIRAPLLAACVAAFVASGRASAQAPAPAPADSAAPPASAPARSVRRDANLITAEEIAAATSRDAYELVSRLRPRWLRGYAAATSRSGQTDPVWIFLDGTRVGPVRELRRITMGQIGELRFIPSEEAVTRWGTGYSAGVILVSTR